MTVSDLREPRLPGYNCAPPPTPDPAVARALLLVLVVAFVASSVLVPELPETEDDS